MANEQNTGSTGPANTGPSGPTAPAPGNKPPGPSGPTGATGSSQNQQDSAENKGAQSAAGGAAQDPRSNSMSQTGGAYEYTKAEQTTDPEVERAAPDSLKRGLDMEADNGDHIAFAIRRFLDKKSVTIITQNPVEVKKTVEGYFARRNMLVDTRDGVFYNEPASFTVQKAHVFNVLGEPLGDESDMLVISD